MLSSLSLPFTVSNYFFTSFKWQLLSAAVATAAAAAPETIANNNNYSAQF